jgi:hypothetical protein
VTPDAVVAAGEQEATPSDDELRDRIDRAVSFGRANRHLDGDQNAAWQIVHGLLAFGKDFEIYHQGKLIPALDYLLGGGELNGWKLTQSQWDIFPGMEATWTLMAYATYLPLDTEWTARDGSEWTIDRIVDMEADQEIDSSPCGGTHRLYGLALALNRHLADGGQLSGPWAKADGQIQAAIAKAKANQQADGSFSSQFFLRPAFSDDIDKRLGASGHTFEFLTLALGNQQVTEPWMTRGLLSLLDMLERTDQVELECGGLYHAMHGLELYRLRRFGPPDEAPQSPTAAVGSATPAPASAASTAAQ